ncbi:hypothetical protein H8356DRAFT_1351097 [Neocallimastix lanati (nom. inval.)]|nr:hypothetical protein H8356DRAFT_1351097 [Neocallimastix sp. JGI-2020a]
MFKKLLTALLIATACITYVCGIKLVGPAIYSDISHLYFLNSRRLQKYIYINRGFYDCFLRNSVANYREIPVGAYLRDTQYKNPDKCRWVTRHISTKNGCYYTPNNTRGRFSWRGYVDRNAHVYDIVGKYCLIEYGRVGVVK